MQYTTGVVGVFFEFFSINFSSSSNSFSDNFKASDVSALKSGQRVEHQKFGFGTVETMDVSGPDRKAKINFDKNGEKTLILSFAKLMILD
jgi:DNA helicase-2/ATP-dependent DNA helicase PcrA